MKRFELTVTFAAEGADEFDALEKSGFSLPDTAYSLRFKELLSAEEEMLMRAAEDLADKLGTDMYSYAESKEIAFHALKKVRNAKV